MTAVTRPRRAICIATAVSSQDDVANSLEASKDDGAGNAAAEAAKAGSELPWGGGSLFGGLELARAKCRV